MPPAKTSAQAPRLIDAKVARKLTVPRSVTSKKGDNGIIMVAGGSRFYHGAPILTSMAALRSGADLVYTAVPRPIAGPVRSHSPALIVLPLPDEKLTVGAAKRLVGMLPKKPDVAAFGMGMSVAKIEALTILVRQLKELGVKLVLDASALVPPILGEIAHTNSVVTPHAGEYERLFGESPGNTENERVINVQRLARSHGITILLKGATDVVSDGNSVGINRTHNCAMTVGGTGDVLAGIVAALLAKMQSFEASLLASYFNGVAGDLALRKVGLHMIASDLIEQLPNAMKTFDKIDNVHHNKEESSEKT